MFKIIIGLILFTNLIVAGSFNFTETRYSDALDKSQKLEGQIEFLKNSLKIIYPKTQRELEYADDVLTYKENSKEIELDQKQQEQIMRYFDIIIMLHHGDESVLEEMFEVSKEDDITLLVPTGVMKNYITKIELKKESKFLSFVKFYFKNSDYIAINIDDEVL